MSINATWSGQSALNGAFGNLVEDDPFGIGRQFERLGQVPGNRLALTVFIGGEPNGISFFDKLLQFSDALLFVGRYLISRGEIMLDIYRHTAFGQIADVPKRRLNDVITAKKLFDSLGFGGTFNDDKVFAHGFEHSTLATWFKNVEGPSKSWFRFARARLGCQVRQAGLVIELGGSLFVDEEQIYLLAQPVMKGLFNYASKEFEPAFVAEFADTYRR